MKKNNKVLMINRGNSDNLGDQAISFTLKSLLLELYNEVHFEDLIDESIFQGQYQVAIKHPQSKNRIFPFRITVIRILWLIRNLNRINRAYHQQYDVVFIGGGQLINANIRFPFSLFIWIIWLSRNPKTKIILFGIGSDQNFSHFDQWLISVLLRKVEKVIVRDYSSQMFLKQQYKIDCLLCPDVVFAIDDFIKVNPTQKSNTVIINPTSSARYAKHHSNKQAFSTSRYWINLVNEYISNGYSVQLFYTTKLDYSACLEVQKAIQEYNGLNISIANIHNLNDLITIISQSSIVVSQRMHALILGYVYNAKLVPIPLSEKIINFQSMYLENNDFSNKNSFKEIIKNTLKSIV